MGYSYERNTDAYYIYKDKYKKYKDLSKNLNEYYNELIVKLNKLDGYLSALRKVSTTNYDNIYGKPINVFNDKCIRTSKDIQVRIKDYKIICSSIKNSLDTVISKKDYYKSKRDYEGANPEIVYVKWWWED